MNIEKSSFSRVMFTVCRLVRVEKIVRRKVFSNSRVDNTFDDFVCVFFCDYSIKCFVYSK